MTMIEPDPAADLEREADRLEHHLETLDDHIDDAKKAASARREEATPDAAGDWEETRGAPGQGEDPAGAIGEHGTAPGATAADADEGEGASGKTSDSDEAASSERSDAVGSRMPGHAAGGDD
jgi:hypothetical protein